MKKIRPERIAEGINKAFNGTNTPSSVERKKICDGCDENKKGVCGICYCIIKAKTKVFEEYCPMNKWKDIKILEAVGVALALKNPEAIKSVSVDEKEKTFILDYGQIKEQKVALKVVLINDRGNFFTEKKDIHNLSTTAGCSCTTLTSIKPNLKEGASSEFELNYAPKGIKPFSKTVWFTSDEADFKILLTGEVVK